MASFDEVKIEDILHGSFATFNPNTGANKDADSTPTIQIYEEGSSTALTITSSVTNITTGRYRWQATIAAADGLEVGKFYEVWITATVTGTDTVTQSAPVMSFKVSSKTVEDLLAPTVPGRTLDVTAEGNAGIDWGNISNETEAHYFEQTIVEQVGNTTFIGNEGMDALLKRNVNNVETTMPEHCLGTIILAMLEWTISGTDLYIKGTDGTTTRFTKVLTTSPSADKITGVN